MTTNPNNDFPDTAFTIDDNAKAAKFLDDHKIPNNLPDPRTLSQTCITAMYDRHISHWVLITRYEGHPDPKQNGLTVSCIPKRMASREKVEASIKFAYVKTAPGTDSSTPFIRL